jgi:hypothetical protein
MAVPPEGVNAWPALESNPEIFSALMRDLGKTIGNTIAFDALRTRITPPNHGFGYPLARAFPVPP